MSARQIEHTPGRVSAHHHPPRNVHKPFDDAEALATRDCAGVAELPGAPRQEEADRRVVAQVGTTRRQVQVGVSSSAPAPSTT